MRLHGKVWVFGDDVSVEHFVPGRYDMLMYTGQVEELSTHLFEDLDPAERPAIGPGDIIVGGRGFGLGKHHDGLVLVMRHIGLAGYIADSFHPLFQRTSIDMGIPACTVPGIHDHVATGDVVDWSLDTDRLVNTTTGVELTVPPASDLLLDIVAAGGWSDYVRNAAVAS